jgi:hypothetical protein
LEAIDGAPRGRKRALSAISVEELEPEEQCEIWEDPEADEDAEYQDTEGDVHTTDEQGNLEVSRLLLGLLRITYYDSGIS